MKKTDIAIIIFIAFISAIFSLVISNMLFGGAQKRQLEVEVVQAITDNFSKPDNRFFNKDAFDPTKQITIEQSQNSNPFSDSTSQ